MRIRQLVRKINKSLGENPKDWCQSTKSIDCILRNSRGIFVYPQVIGLKDKWNGTVQLFELNHKEMELISHNFNKLTKPVSEAKIGQINKRRGWLVKELLKTL